MIIYQVQTTKIRQSKMSGNILVNLIVSSNLRKLFLWGFGHNIESMIFTWHRYHKTIILQDDIITYRKISNCKKMDYCKRMLIILWCYWCIAMKFFSFFSSNHLNRNRVIETAKEKQHLAKKIIRPWKMWSLAPAAPNYYKDPILNDNSRK